jgi:hypothetical protein
MILNILGVAFILFGILYLVYSIMFRNKTTIYFKNVNVIQEKENEYFKYQLYFGILNSIVMMFIGSVIIICNLETLYIVLSPLLFHLVNLIMKSLCKAKGYIKS